MDDSGEIIVTGFNAAIDDFHNRLERENRLERKTNLKVGLAKKKFSSISHEYKMTLERDTEIEVNFNIVSIENLQVTPKGATYGHEHSAVFMSWLSYQSRSIRDLNEIKALDLGLSDKVETFSARATIMYFKTDNIAYPAYPGAGCSRKILQMGDSWRCEKCDQSFIVLMAVLDYSDQAWFQGFNDIGEIVFRMAADELLISLRSGAREDTTHNVGNGSDTVPRPQDQTRVRYCEEAKCIANLLAHTDCARYGGCGPWHTSSTPHHIKLKASLLSVSSIAAILTLVLQRNMRVGAYTLKDSALGSSVLPPCRMLWTFVAVKVDTSCNCSAAYGCTIRAVASLSQL
ncbi:hypothetical protein C8Q74DRAFT_1215953 [Fomes fomentarius]|nr:hypothetical protein C8Q74DRAFT_1215953 [Fomes fomentarius]